MFEISKLSQLRALVSPARQTILDALEAAGPCSVAELAGLLGLRPDRLYYHVRILVRRELLIVSKRRGESGRLEAIYDLPRRPTRMRYVPEKREHVATISKLTGSMLRSALRSFRRGLKPGAVVDGPSREVWAGRRTAWLTRTQLEEVNRVLGELHTLVESGRRPEQGTKLYSLTFVLSPARPPAKAKRSRSRA